jgi:hypothetical protein
MSEAKELKYDSRNYRLHNEKNKRLIRKSLEDCGAGRSIVIDREDTIIAGNGVYEQANEMGLPVRIIESDGSELIAIKRTDLGTKDTRRMALALADNHTSDTSVFDMDAVIEDFDREVLEEWEFPLPSDIDIDAFFEDKGTGKDKEEKPVVCPNCGIELDRSKL